jgi:hypothetical protein
MRPKEGHIGGRHVFHVPHASHVPQRSVSCAPRRGLGGRALPPLLYSGYAWPVGCSAGHHPVPAVAGHRTVTVRDCTWRRMVPCSLPARALGLYLASGRRRSRAAAWPPVYSCRGGLQQPAAVYSSRRRSTAAGGGLQQPAAVYSSRRRSTAAAAVYSGQAGLLHLRPGGLLRPSLSTASTAGRSTAAKPVYCIYGRAVYYGQAGLLQPRCPETMYNRPAARSWFSMVKLTPP